MKEFTVNNKTYSTDSETLALLRQYKNNPEAFGLVMNIGKAYGKIVEIKE